ncbi:hypothetical protein [Actinoplanes palleronii]|uniref:DUF1616 domain-containing protein n=1 Tax=Actinoplanes palleronii TaxID=113570 RepID=A0ABQ4BFG8_9ACTN|nr:hypothetical protein [Actinoplanes palleronii]GIE69392.1 hypothetical protein Apa02nite_055000 [Actinoplanes palleronii]
MKTIFRPLVVAYAGLSVLLPAAGLPWPVLLPAGLLALLAIGELWLGAVTGRPAEAGLPAVRAGLVVLTGLLTLPALALLLYPFGVRVAPLPLIAGAALLATVLAAAGLLRLFLGHATTRTAARFPDPAGSPGCLDTRETPLETSHSRTAARFPDPAGSPGCLDTRETPRRASRGRELLSLLTGRGRFGRAGDGGRPGVPVQRLAGQAPAFPAAEAEEPAAPSRTAAAVTIPIALALVVGAIAVRGVERGPHPELPGYLTVALNGWAAGITHPVTVPARGLAVPVRVTNSGLPTNTQWLRMRVGGAVVAARPVTVMTGKVYALSVRVPPLPPDGCLRAVGISVGGASTVFYARSATTTSPAAAAKSAAAAKTGATKTAGAAKTGATKTAGAAKTAGRAAC